MLEFFSTTLFCYKEVRTSLVGSRFSLSKATGLRRRLGDPIELASSPRGGRVSRAKLTKVFATSLLYRKFSVFHSKKTTARPTIKLPQYYRVVEKVTLFH